MPFVSAHDNAIFNATMVGSGLPNAPLQLPMPTSIQALPELNARSPATAAC